MEPSSSGGGSSGRNSNIPRCCCGSRDCAFLAHNTTILDGLERDVHRAAQLGQALLVRHEAYVADSERDRTHMIATIEALEKEKLELEEKNAQTIKENRQLLDQLEQLNGVVAESDDQVRTLTASLQSTEAEVERLSVLAGRTQALEQQLIDLEREQGQLQDSLDSKTIDERTALQRWRSAEKTIGNLQDQIDRIEKESKEERERHVEIVTRMERRMAVDAELATMVGRPKAKGKGETAAGTGSVVSHFVKDILLDNANLQHGILELREMLTSSNEEVEHLREQLRTHQPVPLDEQAARPTLQSELGAESVVNQELHIHHHYHGPPPKKEVPPIRGPSLRRARKKRQVLFGTQAAAPLPPTTSTTGAILAQTSVTVPSNPQVNRWSNATTLVPSSLPSSPLSSSQYPASIYDRVFSDAAYDSSRPTSPSDTADPGSPRFAPRRPPNVDTGRAKPPSMVPYRSLSTPLSLRTKSTPATAVVSTISPQDSTDVFIYSPSLNSVIHEENEEISEVNSLASPILSPNLEPRGFRRAASHESLISVSGMDIHTLQSRPSQLFYSSSPRFASPSSATSSNPVLTASTATAKPIMTPLNRDSTAFSRSLLNSSLASQRRVARERRSGGLGKVGGWVLGKWGVTPSRDVSPAPSNSTKSVTSTRPDSDGGKRPVATVPPAAKRATDTPKNTPPAKPAIPIRLRPPGINQSGPIWGFFDAIPETPTQVVPTNLDEEALLESLQEGL